MCSLPADVALIGRARAGDGAAFGALVDARIDRCHRIAWSILSNDADADDATQDALVAAWRELPRLREMAAFDGWLDRIVSNAALLTRRRRTRRREVPVTPLGFDDRAGHRDTPEDPRSRRDVDQVADHDAIARAFERLRPTDRRILVLHHVEGRPVAEIAGVLGIPVGTAKWRLFAARRACEQAMDDVRD